MDKHVLGRPTIRDHLKDPLHLMFLNDDKMQNNPTLISSIGSHRSLQKLKLKMVVSLVFKGWMCCAIP